MYIEFDSGWLNTYKISTPTQVGGCWQGRLNILFTCACADNITEHRVANDTKYEHQDIQTYGGCSEIVNVLVEERRKGEYPSLILT